MRQLTKSILSMCAAVLLCSTLLAGTVYAQGADSTYSSTTFLITGYETNSSSIEKGDSVNITVYLSRPDGKTDDIEIIRALDSFTGGATSRVTVSCANGYYAVHLNGLAYSGEGRSLAFNVYSEGGYEPLSLTVRECVPYVEEEPEEESPEAIPAPRVMFSAVPLSAPIKANDSAVISLEVKNLGTRPLKSSFLTVETSSDLVVADGVNSYSLGNIRAGDSCTVLINMKALSRITSESQYINAELSYYYDNNVSSNVSGEASGRITIQADTGSSVASGLKPVLILSGYHYGGGSIAAGSEEMVNITFMNTSKTTAVENVKLTVSGGADLSISGSTNTFYYETIPAGGTKTVSIPFKAAQILGGSSQDVMLSFSYEYKDGSDYSSDSANLSVNIPLYQPDRFEISDPKMAYEGYVGDQNTLTLDYVNKGKSMIYNVEARLSGDIDCTNASQRIGNLEAGKSGTIAFAVMPYNEGENPVVITISYEDGNGDTQERIFEYSIGAMAMEPYDPGEWEEPAYEEPKAAFPWWIVGIVCAIATIVIGVVLSRKKKKAKLAAEAAMWDDWDDEKTAAPAEEKEPVSAAAGEKKE